MGSSSQSRLTRVLAILSASSVILPSTHGYTDCLQRRQHEGDRSAGEVMFYQRQLHSCQYMNISLIDNWLGLIW